MVVVEVVVGALGIVFQQKHFGKHPSRSVLFEGHVQKLHTIR